MRRQLPIKRPTQRSNIVYKGTRPKSDEQNETRSKLCSLFEGFASLHELWPEKFYLANVNGDSAAEFIRKNKDSKFIMYPFQYTEVIHYIPFNYDFGPLHLGAVHMFISRLKVLFDTMSQREEKCVVVVVDELDFKMKLNATFCVAAAALVLFDLTDIDVLRNFQFSFMHPACIDRYKPLYIEQAKKFSDVSGLPSQLKLSLQHCIEGFYLALKREFYNYYTFDHMEYLHYEMVHTGDINWIVPGKLLAFAGPSDRITNNDKRTPDFYFDYFRERHVTDIVRLNSPDYNESAFTEAGFKHHDLIFPDGFPPTSTIARKFIKLTEEAEGAVAVHCFAGIGRTGTLIAAYLVAKYGFTPESAIAWTRICRPGSVIGDQQDWLLNYFEKGGAFYLQKNCNSTTTTTKTNDGKKLNPTQASDNKTLDTNTNNLKPSVDHDDDLSNDPEYELVETELGQAQALVQTKQRRKTLANKSNTKQSNQSDVITVTNTNVITRSSPRRKTKEAKKESANSLDGKNELVLDLGKTLPFNFIISSMMGYDEIGKYPPYYILHDGKLQWKVKFPETGYVQIHLDFMALTEEDKDEIVHEPIYNCKSRYSPPSSDDCEKKKPLIRLSTGLNLKNSTKIHWPSICSSSDDSE